MNQIRSQHMIKLKAGWVAVISKVMWAIEITCLNPKLVTVYKELGITNIDGSITIFDIGANKGQSIKFFRKVFYQPKIYAFEPSEKSFTVLAKLLAKINCNEVTIYRKGVGDKVENRDFFESTLSETSTFILPKRNSRYLKKKQLLLLERYEKSFKISLTQMTTIDTIVKNSGIDRIHILKIDVEGFEFQVILGAFEFLKEKGVVLVQFERHINDMRTDTFKAIHNLLDSAGYIKVREVKHPIGNIFEVFYQNGQMSR